MFDNWQRLGWASGCLILLALLFVSCQPSEPEIEFSPQFEIFDRPQRSDDQLPSFLLSNFEADSARLIDKRNNRTYWVAKNDVGWVCLIIGFNIDRPDFSTAAGCRDENQIAQEGLAVGLDGTTHYSYAIFVPDGYIQSQLAQFEGNYVVANMIAFDSRAALEEAFAGVKSITLTGDSVESPDIILLSP